MTCIVIDADVLRGAGASGTPDSRSAKCRAFLDVMVATSSLSAGATAPLYAEWMKHLSRYSSIWLKSMHARKRFSMKTPAPHHVGEVRAAINLLPDRALRAILEKDRHLLEAAICTDFRLASMDERARAAAEGTVSYGPHLQDIIWVNPEIESDSPLGWIQAGAPAERGRRLGRSS